MGDATPIGSLCLQPGSRRDGCDDHESTLDWARRVGAWARAGVQGQGGRHVGRFIASGCHEQRQAGAGPGTAVTGYGHDVTAGRPARGWLGRRRHRLGGHQKVRHLTIRALTWLDTAGPAETPPTVQWVPAAPPRDGRACSLPFRSATCPSLSRRMTGLPLCGRSSWACRLTPSPPGAALELRRSSTDRRRWRPTRWRRRPFRSPRRRSRGDRP
jgi:hypothetical protein